MANLYLCQHQLELLTRAVEAYKPAPEEKTDHQDLVEYLAMRIEESRTSGDLDPEDIPF